MNLASASQTSAPPQVLVVEDDVGLRDEVAEYVGVSIVMSPFIANLPAAIPEPFVARRANSIFVATR